MRKAMGSLAAAAAMAGLMIALAGPAQANGSFENHPDVRLFHPTPLPPAPPQPHPPVVVNNIVVAVVLDAPYAHRRAAIRRALGHRYLGFVKMYRGPHYPF